MVRVFLFFTSTLLFSVPGWADCTVPLATAGTIQFFTPDLKYCDGTNWQTLASGGALWIANGTGAYYSGSGNVGIGTTSPGRPLNIVTSGSAAPLGVIEVEQRNNSTAISSSINLSHYGNTGGATALNSVVGEFKTTIHDSTSTKINTSNIKTTATNVTNGTVNGLMELQTAVNSILTTAMAINGGNVGIGTTNPIVPLDVAYSGAGAIKVTGSSGGEIAALQIANTNGSAGSGSMIRFLNNSNPTADISSVRGPLSTDGILLLKTRNLTDGMTERMRINELGNVGIGTTAPDTKLHVVGSIKMVDGNQGTDKVMTSDANGVGSWSEFPKFSARRVGGQSISGSPTKLQLSTEDFDTANAFDSATNYRFQPTVAGYYALTGQVYNSGTCGTRMYIGAIIYRNGVAYKNNGEFVDSPYTLHSEVNTLIYLNGSSDYVELYVEHNCGTAENFMGRLEGYRVP